MELKRACRGFAIAALISLCCCASRASPAELEMLTEALRLEAGMRVADVGSGDGEYSVELASIVGPSGHVYVTEVDEDDLEEIRDRLEAEGVSSFTAILGDQKTTGLPGDCCDAILLRLVYHHFTDPPAMRESLRTALKPGALLLAVDIAPQAGWSSLDGVPKRDGHGITMDDLIEEMSADGFEVVARYEDWEGDDDHFAVVFREDERSNESP